MSLDALRQSIRDLDGHPELDMGVQVVLSRWANDCTIGQAKEFQNFLILHWPNQEIRSVLPIITSAGGDRATAYFKDFNQRRFKRP